MINIFAPINNLGYGIHSNNMIKSFIENDIDINLSTIGQIQSDPYFDKYWRSAHDRRTSFRRSAPSLHIFHSEYANQFCGDPMVNFCVFETTKLPDETIGLLKQMDMVFTTTQDHKEILEGNGLSVPIHVVHEGVDSNLYNTNDCESWINTGKFTFITVGKHEKRKNTDLIIRSYIETLQYQESALICHTLDPFFDRRKNDVPFPGYTDIDPRKYGYTDMQQTDKYVKVSNGMSDIYFTKPINSAIYMRSLYRSANVGIALSRAEGWDLPAMEMMACGIPTIISNTIGHKEYIKDLPSNSVQGALIIDPAGMEVAEDGKWFMGNRGDWAVIDKDSFSTVLEDVYDDMEVYQRPYPQLSKYFHDNFSWSIPAKQVSSILY